MADKRFLPEPEDGEELAPADQMYYDDMAWWNHERLRRMTPEELKEEEESNGTRARECPVP